jgi:hypothetical protein
MSALQPHLVHSLVWENIRPFIPQIRCRDESFFLDKDYTVYEDQVVGIGGSIDIVNVIKSIWRKSMTASDKECVWEHLDALVTGGVIVQDLAKTV